MDGEKSAKIKEKRICIYPKDIQLLTGKSERTARKIMVRIKQIHSKDKHQLVTIKEFCEYTGLDEIEVKKLLM